MPVVTVVSPECPRACDFLLCCLPRSTPSSLSAGMHGCIGSLEQPNIQAINAQKYSTQSHGPQRRSPAHAQTHTHMTDTSHRPMRESARGFVGVAVAAVGVTSGWNTINYIHINNECPGPIKWHIPFNHDNARRGRARARVKVRPGRAERVVLTLALFRMCQAFMHILSPLVCVWAWRLRCASIQYYVRLAGSPSQHSPWCTF